MRRSTLWFVVAVVLLKSSVVYAGPPDPERCSVALTGQGAPCQFRFRADGGLDDMILSITVRDAFDAVHALCPTRATLMPTSGTLALSSCDSLSRAGRTDRNGAIQFTFSRIGGRGDLDLRVSVFEIAPQEIRRVPISFTSPDLDANSTVNIIDLGLWAGGLPPGYLQTSDYDCNGTVNIIDLGVWAGGLGLGCGSAPAKVRE